MADSSHEWQEESDLRDSLLKSLPGSILWQKESSISGKSGDSLDIVGFDKPGDLAPRTAIELKLHLRPGVGVAGRLEFINDVARLQHFVEDDPARDGYAVLVTTDPTEWGGIPSLVRDETDSITILNVYPAIAEGWVDPAIHNQYLEKYVRGSKPFSLLLWKSAGEWSSFRSKSATSTEARTLIVPVHRSTREASID